VRPTNERLAIAVLCVIGVLAITTACARPHERLPGRSVEIDTDGGIDDLMAIALLLSDPSVRLRGVTTVRGLLTARQAASRLRAVGFQVQELARTVSSRSQAGTVVDEQPGGGRKAPAGTTVTIYVGRI
jgi:hypothetical protein